MKRRFRLRMIGLAATSLMTSLAAAQVLYDNGPVITHPDGGFNNAARSVMQTNGQAQSVYGFGCQLERGNRLADDFEVPPGARFEIAGFGLYGYQTAQSPYDFVHANVRMWDGTPGAGGSVIAGNTFDNLLVQFSSLNVYRVSNFYSQTENSRLIHRIVAKFPSVITVAPGTYWLDWQLEATVTFPGPWTPPVSIIGLPGKPGANARQWYVGTSEWQPLMDFGPPAPQDLPFQVLGSWLTNPHTMEFVNGRHNGGTVADLATSDDHYMTILCNDSESATEVVAATSVTTGGLADMQIALESNASRADLTQFLYLKKVNGEYDFVGSSAVGLEDSLQVLNFNLNISQYVQTDNTVKVRIVTIPSADVFGLEEWQYNLDWIELKTSR